MMRRSLITVTLAMVISLSCDRSEPPPAANTVVTPAPMHPVEPSGDTKLPVDGGKIWYRLSGNGTATPVMLLHGGPGFSSYYMKPFEDLGNDRTVVRYDQLGGGKSDHVNDTTLFTIPHFVRELDSLRSHLGYDKVHLVGHSWGTILALEYYRAHPGHVASLTLGSAALDIPEWERHAKSLLPTLSDSAQRAVAEADVTHKYDSPGYIAAINEFYGKYVWRHPVQADLDSTMSTMNEGVYNYMQGPSEFTITGTLKKYDAKAFLKDIKVPVLYTVGEFDEANPQTIRRFADLTPGAQVAILAGAAHMTTWDARDENVRVVRQFLRQADAVKPAVR